MRSDQPASTNFLLALWEQHPFRLHIAVIFTLMVFAVGAVLVWSNYEAGRNIVLLANEDAFSRIDREIVNDMDRVQMPVEAVVDALSRSTITSADSYEARMRSLPQLVAVLQRQSVLQSVYVGYSNGDFFQLHALRNDADRKRFAAPANAAYRLQSIEHGVKRTRLVLFDSALNPIEDVPAPVDYKFDPRTRPWFVQAMKESDLVQTTPYVFFTTQEVGQTFARRAEHGRAVFGADITLKQLSDTLALARPTRSSQLALFGEDGGVIAQTEPRKTPAVDAAGNFVLSKIAQLSPVFAAATKDNRRQKVDSLDVDGREWLVRIAPAAKTGSGMTYLAVATPSDELLTEALTALRRETWLALALVVLSVPVAWWLARRIAANLNALTDQAAAIRRFNFETPAPVRSRVIEIRDLGLAMAQMRETIHKFIDITTALSAERKFDRLLRRVLDEACNAAGANGAIIYLLEDDGKTLKAAEEIWPSGTSGKSAAAPALAMQRADNPIVQAAKEESTSITHAIAIVRPVGLEFLDAHFGRAEVTLTTVRLLDRAGKGIGMLCMFSDTRSALTSPERMALVNAFAGAGGVAIDNQRLIAAQKALVNSLISLIAGAIDAKSHYTAGHCARVPELTNMLTRAACDARQGPFATFNLDEEQWESLHIAGGLHDCGKVTTPEYVVDKATKLETIYDRIHEVRMRFEVLKRDAEIACLKAIAAGGDAAKLKASLATELAALDEDFAFVASCNVGTEFMAPEKAERLKSIARRTWHRTLDDRLGISWEEGDRKAKTPADPLPATEYLLADKREHIIERQPSDRLKQDNVWGFKLDMPAALYNRGELYNLSIARGTLTAEERYKINDHIVQTIIMLSALPFPGRLKAVPELAGGHHEKMDGTGFPKRLHRDEMSIPARIMAIADIFEALTAADRPYKKAKKLSEAIKIMGSMKKDQHIDPDLFDLFLRSGVYLNYARRFMRPEYIDNVDVDAYLGKTESVPA